MRIRGWLAACLTVILATVAAAPARGDVVVHEWGTFTTHHGGDGTPVVWKPLDRQSDLPTFVYEASARATRKLQIEGTVRMETPVLYFYADERRTVSVGVDFPSGLISEWYPRVRKTRAGVRWPRVTILPAATATLPREDAPSHYYPARETDAALLRCRDGRRTQHEKFLFYRGVGTFDVPIRIRLDGERVRIGTTGPDALARVLLFERRNAGAGFRTVDLAGGEALVDRPEPSADAVTALEDALRTLLVGQGLYPREAQAMLDTWRDTWSEDGLRALYLVPSRLTDEVLPLSITPRPASIVRVLVGRAEVVPPGA